MSTRTKQLTTLQAGRALAAIAVMFCHCHALMVSRDYFNANVGAALGPGNSGVQFFFVLSGFVILLAHRRDLGNPASLGTFFKKRFNRIYPPMWMILLVLVALYFAVPSLGDTTARHAGVITSAFLAAPTTKGESFLPVEWTLRHEVLFYLLFSLTLLKKRVGIVVLACWCSAGLIVPWMTASPILNFFFSSNHVLFGLGMLVCLSFQRQRISNGVSSSLLSIGAVTFASAWILRARWDAAPADGFFLGFGVGSTLMVLGLVNLERNGALRAHRLIVYLGEASYAIYLVHYTVLITVAKALRHTTLHTHPWIALVAMSFSGIIVGTAFHSWLEKPIVQWLNRKFVQDKTLSVTAA